MARFLVETPVVPGSALAACAVLACTLAPLALAGCATTDATYGGGVGDTDLEPPPRYAGRSDPSATRIR